jgi:hypothetical protein
MDPATIAAAASAGQAILGFKGNRALARQAKQLGEYQETVIKNEAEVLARRRTSQEIAVKRQQAERLKGVQRVATAKSGVQMAGSPLQALADTYFSTERDAQRIQYAGSLEQTMAASQAAMARIEGKSRAAAFNMQAVSSLLSAAGGYASSQQQNQILGQQQAAFELRQQDYQRRLRG